MLETLLPEQKYFSIKQVSELTSVEPHVIRYWETRFGSLRPDRRDSGQRKFTHKEIDAIMRIKQLLYNQRYTIDGARKLLQQESRRGTAQLKLNLGEAHSPTQTLDALRNIRKELEEVLQLLRGS
jgi:DNA-binding transcriptional MerR regulator